MPINTDGDYLGRWERVNTGRYTDSWEWYGLSDDIEHLPVISHMPTGSIAIAVDTQKGYMWLQSTQSWYNKKG